ncbi:MAG TPA: pantoate--beta-alanine ligase [Bacteroidia bacterium]|nr:pantoate--beta-alanine ligase [Bacteroidia bacterium]
MKVFSKINQVKSEIIGLKTAGNSIGFVPTMGALHQGHISLIEKAKLANDVVVCSIFVNPAQFNDKSDLLKYPRTLEKDLEMLESAGTDLVFTPETTEIYPDGEAEEKFDFGNLDKVMEGAHRPGHFRGVAKVVAKLFRIVTPDKAYFGEKDFQQLVIIKKLEEKLFPEIQIIACPTVREEDGLAISSRNILLDMQTREAAALISKTLFQVKELKNKMSINELKTFVEKKISSSRFLELGYFEIVDESTLQPLTEIMKTKSARAFIAVKAGAIRLIDNVSLNS